MTDELLYGTDKNAVSFLSTVSKQDSFVLTRLAFQSSRIS